MSQGAGVRNTVDADSISARWKTAGKRYSRSSNGTGRTSWNTAIRDPLTHLTPGDGCTVATLCNAFLNSKRRAMEAGELTPRSFEDYRKTTDRIVAQFGRHKLVEDLQPSDFEKFRSKLAGKYGTVTLKNIIGRCRVVFKYASDNRLIESPVHYGQAFNKPSAKAIREVRNTAGVKLFEAAEVRRILDTLDVEPVMKANGSSVVLRLEP